MPKSFEEHVTAVSEAMTALTKACGDAVSDGYGIKVDMTHPWVWPWQLESPYFVPVVQVWKRITGVKS